MQHPVLQKLERFCALSDQDKKLLLEVVAAEREIAARVEFISEGDNLQGVHVVTSGLACRYKRLRDGRQQIVAFLLPGDFCDPHAFMSGAITHNVATIPRSKIAEVPRLQMMSFLDRPALAQSLIMSMLVDTAILREWIASIGQRSAEERIAHLFCELHSRLQAVGLTFGDSVPLPINQRDLSDAVGMSVVHVNRALKSLREKGFAALKKGMLTIQDAKRIESMCGFTPTYLHLL